MKVFIVFLGLLIINIGFLSYQGDMERYVRCQAYLKAVAEECAAGAALYYEEESFSDGQFRFCYEEGKKYIEFLLEESRNIMPLPSNSIITYNVYFQDDFSGYDSESGNGQQVTSDHDGGTPSVTVELTAETEDLFRLSFLKVTEIRRAAKYELPQ